MSRVWARHYQDDWQARAGDRRLPYWLRVAAAAYGAHGENGHAVFKRGQLALILATVDHDTGEVQPYGHVGRAIADAVEFGWLEDGSYWGCLIVPAHSIRRGDLMRRPNPCPLAPRHARFASANTPLDGGYDSHSSTPHGGFAARTRHVVAVSTPEHLCSDSVSHPAPKAAS
ncbi:hypothetical protein J2X64_000539 [Phycicoccus sp. 3266]|nr:hypothetical protein [Phycicoccus sp. 3266]